jgi:hypothetical protein
VAEESHENRHLRVLGDLEGRLVEEIEHFFVSYNEMAGKEVCVVARHGLHRAETLVKKAMRRCREEHGREEEKAESNGRRKAAKGRRKALALLSDGEPDHPPEQLRRQRMIQPPGNTHGAAAGMANVTGRAQKGVGGCQVAGLPVLAPEQKDRLAKFLVANVPLSRLRIGGRGTLRLPVEEVLVDGVVLVHGRGRKVLFRLVQGKQEYIRFDLRDVQDPFAALPAHRARPTPQGGQNLIAGVLCMQGKRTEEGDIQRWRDLIDAAKAEV